MRKWLAHVFRGPTLLAALAALAVTIVSIRLAPTEGEAARASVYTFAEAAPPEPGADATTIEVGRHATASVHHVRVTGKLATHFHREHDEQVVVVRGNGAMTVGGETHVIAAGSVLVIPRGTVHSLAATGGTVEMISVFSPPFDGKDHLLVE